MKQHLATLLIMLAGSGFVRADGPRDNNPNTVRRVPRIGVNVSPVDGAYIEKELATLANLVETLRAKKDTRTQDLLPDIEIFGRAAHDALHYREFFSQRDVGKAKHLLAIGQKRARQLINQTATAKMPETLFFSESNALPAVMLKPPKRPPKHHLRGSVTPDIEQLTPTVFC